MRVPVVDVPVVEARFPPVEVRAAGPDAPRTGIPICDVRFEVRCLDRDAWTSWWPGLEPCGWRVDAGRPDLAVPTDLPGSPAWGADAPPHVFTGRDGWHGGGVRTPDGPWLGQWRIVGGSGRVLTRFDGLWAVDARPLAVHLGALDAWRSGRSQVRPGAPDPRFTAFELWDWIEEHRSGRCPVPDLDPQTWVWRPGDPVAWP